MRSVEKTLKARRMVAENVLDENNERDSIAHRRRDPSEEGERD